MDEFLDESADRSTPSKYTLHAVMVHAGHQHGGHYYTFIKPDPGSRWLKFDDDQVLPVMDRDVLEANYGGETLRGPTGDTRGSTTAYILEYVRDSKIKTILAPLTENDSPPHLSKSHTFFCLETADIRAERLLREDRLDMERKKREREEQRLFMKVKVKELFLLLSIHLIGIEGCHG